ncbi:hydroxymethylglutaryl-CoA lyase [Chitinophaga costaii]|uniref:Hydroxymethylglutaryl-CoA lyase n=1 Tax=Chitinophaga costaii TaxID=1335309 RepID=A0A1C3YW35_9BACT|nr:hydroxymethylglutaryl-CoA lyase [Chitinophaga costaii]PUZ30125.1 hydroxymethylglutaryl-CoA lyase [Chitinophaga costaii]SCB74279.1 hydroxymethylglutaryl-CoA lyase [Chitinophaga costaii]
MKLIECPRDAMQGWHRHIATVEKIAYLDALLQVGFDTLDFGSFVSPKAIPQMADTQAVLAGLTQLPGRSKLLAIVANLRGAEEAVMHDAIRYLGFPFSISETFQLRNANKTIAASMEEVQTIQELCIKNNKQLVIYISMGFGNPYGDPYNTDIVLQWVSELAALEIPIISLADTVGLADPPTISYLYKALVPAYPAVEFGAHFHAAPHQWEEKVRAAWDQGCRRFDSAIKGIGGCPMAKDELVGNIATENLLDFLARQRAKPALDKVAWEKAYRLAEKIFVP